MNTTTKGAIIGGSIASIINLLIQAHKSKANTDSKFNWEQLFVSTVGGAFAGGSIGYFAGKKTEQKEIERKEFDITQYLKTVSKSNNINSSNSKYFKEGEKLKAFLGSIYKNKTITAPSYSGSINRDTAIGRDFDIDIKMEFKHKSFKSLESMYEDVYNTLKNKYPSNYPIKNRKQKVSIGVSVNIKGNTHSFDIVPARRINKNSTSSNLYDYNSSSRIKTNFQKQANNMSGENSEKFIVKMLKKMEKSK